MKPNNLWMFLVLIGSTFCTAKQLPAFIQRCKRASPHDERNKCIMAGVEDVKSHLIEGIPGVKLPQIEPLLIPKVEAHLGNGDGSGFNLMFTDFAFYGVKDFKVEGLDLVLENRGNLFLHIFIPDLRARASYSAKGKLSLFELDATGPASINMTGINIKVNRDLTIVTKNGKEFVKFGETHDFEMSYATIKVYLDDLIRNNKELTEQTNKAINDNYATIAKEINQLIQEGVYSVIHGIIKTFVEDYSLDELFE